MLDEIIKRFWATCSKTDIFKKLFIIHLEIENRNILFQYFYHLFILFSVFYLFLCLIYSSTHIQTYTHTHIFLTQFELENKEIKKKIHLLS